MVEWRRVANNYPDLNVCIAIWGCFTPIYSLGNGVGSERNVCGSNAQLEILNVASEVFYDLLNEVLEVGIKLSNKSNEINSVPKV